MLVKLRAFDGGEEVHPPIEEEREVIYGLAKVESLMGLDIVVDDGSILEVWIRGKMRMARR